MLWQPGSPLPSGGVPMNYPIYANTADHILIQPDLSDKPFYPALFYLTAFKSMFSKHGINAEKRPRYISTFYVSGKRLMKWYEVFNVEQPSAVQIPFTYVSTSGTMVLLRILADMGINFKFVRHFKNETHIYQQSIKTDVVYSYITEISEVIQLREDRVILLMETTVLDQAGQIVCIQKDYWIILEVPSNVMTQAKPMICPPEHYPHLQELPKRHAGLKNAPAVSIYIPKDMGKRYGQVSGDLNPLHITKFMAKRFGFARPFIQGFCAINFVLKHLTLINGHAPRELSITFVRPIFVDQTVELRYDEGSFEVCDVNNKLLAAGKWKAR
jgi:hypothetical protein